MIVTYEQVMERLNYDPSTGVFTRRMRTSNSVHVGDVSGNLRNDGYRQIRLCGRLYLTGRLAFLMVHGRWPDPEVDHINGDRSDDRIENLREVTRRQNNQNHECHRAGKLLGAVFVGDHYRKNPWRARIGAGGGYTTVGYFATELEAHKAYMAALEEVPA